MGGLQKLFIMYLKCSFRFKLISFITILNQPQLWKSIDEKLVYLLMLAKVFRSQYGKFSSAKQTITEDQHWCMYVFVRKDDGVGKCVKFIYFY